ncbi:MAG: hypothetical protein EXR37_03635 [Limnohabitans sp.]|nr:hypothetical protein [Limnohabitans sp.]
MHIELVVRELYGQAFYGGQSSDAVKDKVRKQLARNIPALAKLTKFAPYMAGDTFTLADCAAVFHLPIVSSACKLVLEEDVFADIPIKAYTQQWADNPHMKKIQADRKANGELMATLRAART